MAPKRELDFNPIKLPQDMLAAIGLALTCSAQTENIVESGIGGCLGIDLEYGNAVTTHMSAPLRDSVFRSAAEIRIDDLDALDELDTLLDNINDAFTRRNIIAHNGWCRDEKTGEMFVVKTIARTRVEMDLIPMTVDRVKSDAKIIYDAGMALMNFLMRFKLLPALPTPLRPRAHKSKAERKKRRERLLASTKPKAQ